MSDSIEKIATSLRAALLDIERETRKLGEHTEFKHGEQAYPGQHAEMIAQSKLALRHIEDARMRLGKVLQYGRDGISIYDRKEQP